MGVVLHVDPAGFLTASASTRSVASQVFSAGTSLVSGLGDCGSMAGSDSGGAGWADQYDQAATAILPHVASLATGLDSLGDGLQLTGYNHAAADWASAGNPGEPAGYSVPTQYPAATLGSVPSAHGGKRDWPPGFDLVSGLVGMAWPDGDTDRLRHAAGAWDAAAEALGKAADALPGALSGIDGFVAPEIPLIHEKFDTARTASNDLAGHCRTVAGSCRELAGEIEKTHKETTAELQELVLDLEITLGASVALTFLTAGVSDAVGAGAAATRTALTVGRLIEFFTSLAAKAGAIAGRIAEAVTGAARIGSMAEKLTVKLLVFTGKTVAYGTGNAATSAISTGIIRGPNADLAGAAYSGFIGGAGGSILGRGAAAAAQKIGTGLAARKLATAEVQRLATAAGKVEILDGTGLAHYASDGTTISTKDLVHPRADLENHRYPAQDAGPGLTTESPLVTNQIPENFKMWGGTTREEYARKYTDGTYPNGAPHLRNEVWPDRELHPEGFLTPESRTPIVLRPGHLIDRYGGPRGNFTSPVGENFPGRALPDFSLEKFDPQDGYHQYEVLREIPAWAGPAAPAIGKSGGATQYYTNFRVKELLEKGFIREVTP